MIFFLLFKLIGIGQKRLKFLVIWPLIGPPLFGYLLFQPFNQVVVNKQKLFGNAGQKRVMLKSHM